MSEYTADELAEDSDDEKCLEKAEKMTERKASRQKVDNQQRPYRRPANSHPMSETSLPALSVPGSTAPFKHQIMAQCTDATNTKRDQPMFCLWANGASAKLLPKAQPQQH